MTETATYPAGAVDGSGAHATPPTPAPTPAPARRPSKFLADLTKAMQTAAEAAREEAVGRLQADAKAAIEDIHGRSATEATDLRRRADDDVSAIREWSKQEIARIRDETEHKVSDRKAQLEREIEDHAALIERQIDRVQSRVTTFESQMATFFERLLAEQDPTRFAEMAESLPEPPPFDEADGWPASATAEEPAATGSSESTDVWRDPPASVTPVSDDRVAETTTTPTEASAESTEAAMAAIQAAAEAAATDEVAETVSTEAQATEASPADSESFTAETQSLDRSEDADASAQPGDTEQVGSGQPVVSEQDPRLTAFGLTADFAAAEAEAAASIEGDDEAEDIPVIDDGALAARLAGLVPAVDEARNDGQPETKVTQVVVVGLVSVASIASFKRHLGRLAGVQSVGVTSGPDGEFVFSVTHNLEIVLRDAVPAMPGFKARVTGGSDDVVEVTAHDPESEG